MPDQLGTTCLKKMLKERRTSLGLSVRGLAAEVGIHHTTLLGIESGRVDQPRADILRLLAARLDLDVVDVLTLAGYGNMRLPGFGVYLRTATRLPAEAIDELSGFYDYLRSKYEVAGAGPVNREDEDDQSST